MSSERQAERIGIFVISITALVALWVVGAWAMADPDILPSPQSVLAILWHEAARGTLWMHMEATLWRVAAAFGLAMGAGAVLGTVLGMSPRLNRWLDPWVVVALNLPALVVIVLCYLWLGLNEVAAIAAVAFNKTALVLVTVREGARALERDVSEMAQVYRMGRWARIRHVILPQLAPYFAASARNGLAIIWKLVLVVEFLGRSNGVGFQIHLYFQLFEVGHVMAYAGAFVGVMLAIEYAFIQPWESRANRWRQQPA